MIEPTKAPQPADATTLTLSDPSALDRPRANTVSRYVDGVLRTGGLSPAVGLLVILLATTGMTGQGRGEPKRKPAAAPPATRSPADFNRDVLPILSDKCFHCHGPDQERREADLRLDVRDDVFADRDGKPLVVAERPEVSELIRRITSNDLDERMPPADQPRQLSPAEIETLESWIKQGARWTQHWAFAAPSQATPPSVEDTHWPRGAIDRFVLAGLEQKGFRPAPEADRATLITRVTLDLTGLRPTPADVVAFLADDRPDAYERLVDRLLQSPRYGEHQATTWLDAARYADTDGYQNDRLRYMSTWRDWVIAALNANQPFDQFTIEQLAGDLLPDASFRQQIATGFCRNHRINSEGGSIPGEWRVEYVADRVETLGTVWLGLTIGCARCHDHKYDPITQRDFYRLFAFFNNVPEWGLGPNNGNSPPLVSVPKNWPLLNRDQDRAVTPAPYQLKTTQTSVVRPLPGGPETAMVMHEMGTPRDTYVLIRGRYDQPDKSEALTAGIPESLGQLPTEAAANRLMLARWIVGPDNPLTARVIVNRYWQSFFGVGLVTQSENFGIQGDAPSHPELLDWLAVEFRTSGWNVKAMHRRIVTTATYRQSSQPSSLAARRDPDNRLLARGPRLRLPAQVIRDQSLAVSGLLIERIGGKSVKPYMPPGLWRSISNAKYVQDHGAALYRRSLYTYWRRTVPPPTMMTFNAGQREVCVVRKPNTNSPLQALTLMNNILFVESARMLAERMITEGGNNDRDRLQRGFQLALGRPANDQELRVLSAALISFRGRYAGDRAAANQLLKVGEHPRNQEINPAEHAAMTMVASTILNMDEFIMRE